MANKPMIEPIGHCGGVNEPACPSIPCYKGKKLYSLDDMKAHGATQYAKGKEDKVAGKENTVSALTDPLFMTEKEMLIESVRNSRLTLSVEQDILAILQAQKG